MYKVNKPYVHAHAKVGFVDGIRGWDSLSAAKPRLLTRFSSDPPYGTVLTGAKHGDLILIPTFNPFTAILASPSLGKRPIKVPN